jgi:leucyl aminopeptidase (aminopeptidase T)
MKADQDIRSAAKSLLGVNMGLTEGEKLLLMSDDGGETGEIVEEMTPAAREFGMEGEPLIFKPQGGHGQEPPEEVWRRAMGHEAVDELTGAGLLSRILTKSGSEEDQAAAREIAAKYEPMVDVVVAVTGYSTSHTTFRKLLTETMGARYASMPLFTRGMFYGPLAVDEIRLADSTNSLALAMAGVERCEVSSANGTELVLGLTGRPAKPDNGLLTAPGSFGNLPAGEVFFAPVEGTAEGTLVIEWSPTEKLPSPLVVTVTAGRAVKVDGQDTGSVRWLEELLAAHPGNTNIAELGIGTNPGARRPDNVLESEKILGTVHVAFGDNHTFGGKVVAPFHMDFVVFEADLTAVWEQGGARRVLLSEGKRGW